MKLKPIKYEDIKLGTVLYWNPDKDIEGWDINFVNDCKCGITAKRYRDSHPTWYFIGVSEQEWGIFKDEVETRALLFQLDEPIVITKAKSRFELCDE